MRSVNLLNQTVSLSNFSVLLGRVLSYPERRSENFPKDLNCICKSSALHVFFRVVICINLDEIHSNGTDYGAITLRKYVTIKLHCI